MARGNEYFTDSRRPPAARSTSASAGVLAAVVTLVDEQEAPWVERADDAAGVPRGRKSKRARASRCAEGVRALSKCSPGAATSSPRASHCRERPSASAAAGGSRPGASPGVAARVVRQEIKNLSGVHVALRVQMHKVPPRARNLRCHNGARRSQAARAPALY